MFFLKILVFSELYYPHGSGGELATYLYTNLLSKAGHDLIVVTQRFHAEPVLSRSGRITIYRLPIFGPSGENKYSTLRRLDLILTNSFKTLVKWSDVVYLPKYWYSIILLAKSCRKPVVVHSHGLLPVCPLAIAYDVSKQKACTDKMPFCLRCIYRYEKLSGRSLVASLGSSILNDLVGSCFSQAIKLSDAIITVSESQRVLLLKSLPSLGNKVHVIYNPLPNLHYAPINGADFGYFGGPSIQKGFRLLNSALMQYAKLYSQPIKIHSTCFNTSNAQYVYKLNQKGIIAYGRLDDKSYDKLYEKIRAVIVPSVWPEVYGYVAVEAFLRGRLVVASRIGGLAEVTDGCPGAFMFEPSNYHELADQLQVVRSLSSEAASNLGVQNRQFILKKFSNETIVKQLTTLFSGIIG